ncbi:probable salivary secreted peptide [Phymastichus coffea]|uniref:probable salivary secreted peptide n=1 Tax=Phymastichus coffea TaxID=108790 RepID=UPI00273AC85A|nr:probable salivary secreted peptide [Phymastichus coffea]
MGFLTNTGLLVALTVALTTVVTSTQYGFFNNDFNTGGNKSHNLIIGTRQPGDQQMYRENIIKKSKWMSVVTVTKTYQTSNYTISQIRALDQKTNGKGAIAQRISGGIGFNNVTLKFKSLKGHGINFVVELYGHHRY